MDTMKQVAFTLCLASFSTGVLLHLFPDAAARRCMKAVAGLYILSAVLSGGQQARILLADMQSEVTHAVEESTSGAIVTDTQATDFTARLLRETKDSLNEQYNAYLLAQGYDASIDISLVHQEGVICVQGACITSVLPLSAQEKVQLSDYFTGALGMIELSFASEEGKSP